MKLNWKRTLLTAVACGLFSTSTAFAKTVSMNLFYDGKNHAYQAQEVKINIDGKELVPTDVPAVIIGERTMLPMRLIAKELGCEVIWTEQTKQAFVINDEMTVGFTIDSKTGLKNGQEFTMDVPAKIVNDRTVLPLRALAKALDLTITWDDATRTVYIKTSDAGDPPTVTTPDPTGEAIVVRSIGVPTATTNSQVFSINASSAIASYDEVYVDDTKIVLDVYYATSSVAENITATNSSVVTAIRSAQHEQNGVPYTRVVFDLNGKQSYAVTQSADQTKLLVTFETSTIEELTMSHRSGTDKIVITGDGGFGANVFTLANPNRIVIDIPNAKSELKNDLDIDDDLEFVTSIRTGMQTSDTLRIVLEVGMLTEHTWDLSGEKLTLEVNKSSLQALSFDATENALYLERHESIDLDDVAFDDHYLDGYYEVTLPGDYSDVYGYGTLKLGDEITESVQIQTKNGNTVIRFNQKQIREYEIEKKGDYYVINSLNPKEVYDKVLLLDAGHGGSAPGTTGNGQVEKNANLDVVLKINDALKNSGIKVYLTRNSDTNPSNNSRAVNANQAADLMVSIHMNAATDNTVANGTETLYAVHSNDNAKKLTSLIAAEILQSEVVSALDTTNRGVKKRTDLLILNATNVPAVLVEVCFLSNPGDALKISNNANQTKVAEAIARGIEDAMSDYDLR